MFQTRPPWRPHPLSLLDEEVQALVDPGYLVRDGVLGEALSHAVELEARALVARGVLHPAGVSRASVLDSAVRSDEMTWLDRGNSGPATQALLDAMEALRKELNAQAYLDLTKFDVQLARYAGNGARYARHRDAFSDARQNRRVTAIYYANADWQPEQGGQLRVYPAGREPQDLAPLLDRMVIFLSDRLEHEVLPAFGDRIALTAWFYQAGL